MLLVCEGARTFGETIAIEIDPAQHDINPIRYRRTPRAAAAAAEEYDETKHNLCKQLGMRFLPLSRWSWAQHTICEQWLTLLEHEMVRTHVLCLSSASSAGLPMPNSHRRSNQYRIELALCICLEVPDLIATHVSTPLPGGVSSIYYRFSFALLAGTDCLV